MLKKFPEYFCSDITLQCFRLPQSSVIYLSYSVISPSNAGADHIIRPHAPRGTQGPPPGLWGTGALRFCHRDIVTAESRKVLHTILFVHLHFSFCDDPMPPQSSPPPAIPHSSTPLYCREAIFTLGLIECELTGGSQGIFSATIPHIIQNNLFWSGFWIFYIGWVF